MMESLAQGLPLVYKEENMSVQRHQKPIWFWTSTMEAIFLTSQLMQRYMKQKNWIWISLA
jgi:hypothetical protein